MIHNLSFAISQALREAGVLLATHVPGHGATETFQSFRKENIRNLPISFHEETAYAIAHGSALTGARSACIIKSHGMTKAMNAALDSLSCGVKAAMVNIVFEDKTGNHSDNIIEIIPFIAGSEMPFKVSSAKTAYADVMEAVRMSEKMELPFTLVFDAAEIEAESPIGNALLDEPPRYYRDPMQHLVCPIFASYQREVLVRKIRNEDWRDIPRPHMPILPTSLPPDYQRAVAPYLPLFEVFRSLEVDFVCGDAGVSTLSAFPPYEIVHAALYMGGSIPTAIGAYLAGMNRSWCFIGDFSFIAAGHYGLIEAIMRKTPLNVLIFANGRAQTTGGQPLDLQLLDILLAGYEQYILRITNPFDPDEVRTVLSSANESDELRIVIANYTANSRKT
ncbi:MAG TPA: thiamine pyrophosphate-dependent enzyme [Candidatus Kapabacteria bacterium]|jgi:TPP-dependent indolepyruvate ferredoxin oxidoreductase alpha subunit|nr:thiamine pyrophosphate-dependent enzyme [Candidatus Kapabacteria bacterium]